jgi:hypothetical protein
MKQLIINRKFTFTLGALFLIPTAWFILISLLKYGFGVPYLFDSTEPLLEKLGIKESLGWTINLLILFGPSLALMLNVLSILKIEFDNGKDLFSVRLSIQKHWLNLLIIFIAGSLLSILFVYLMGENCRC